MTPPRVPSAEDCCTGNWDDKGHIEDCDCVCLQMRDYARAVLEAAAEVALESAEVWQAVRDIRALKEDL